MICDMTTPNPDTATRLLDQCEHIEIDGDTRPMLSEEMALLFSGQTGRKVHGLYFRHQNECGAFLIVRLGLTSVKLLRFGTRHSLRRTGLLTELLDDAIRRWGFQRTVICDVPDECSTAKIVLSRKGFIGHTLSNGDTRFCLK